MLNLIKLELKRVSLKSHFIGLLAANIVIALLSAFTSSLLNAGGGVAVTGLPPAQLDTLTLAIMLVRATLIIWEAVLISVFIVEEYRNKTINLLFTYPVQRGKLIAVKIILICVVMLLFHALSGVFQFTCLSVASKYFPFVTVSPANLITQAVTALSAVLLGLLPLYIGMIKKSTIATIVSSFASCIQIHITALSDIHQGCVEMFNEVPAMFALQFFTFLMECLRKPGAERYETGRAWEM